MLVLTRRPGEELVVNGNIIVRVERIANGSVRIGIDAPREITVNRREVEKRIAQEGRLKPLVLPVASVPAATEVV